jgi:uncharacterized protein YqjF (DUF2071 family)
VDAQLVTPAARHRTWLDLFLPHKLNGRMNLLKRIPVHYKGELHDVRLINFSVAMDEVRPHVPVHIPIRNFNGRALISMVDVKLKRMRPVWLPFIRFDYRHIAFRLLVDDGGHNDGLNKGIYFYRSFTDKRLIVTGGKLFTDYNLETGRIQEINNTTEIIQGNQFVKYHLGKLTAIPNPALQNTIGALDRAYSMLGERIRVTQIQREKWPIQLTDCTDFETNFFTSAKLEGAFRVHETIYYDWLPPKFVVA